MATVTGFTAERMLVIENETVIDGEVQGDNLILQQRGGAQIDAGNVRGPKGDKGDTGPAGEDGLIDSVNDDSSPHVYAPRIFVDRASIDAQWAAAPNGSMAVSTAEKILWEKDDIGWFMRNDVRTFADVSERDARWPTPPDGSICQAPVGTEYRRIGGVWVLWSSKKSSDLPWGFVANKSGPSVLTDLTAYNFNVFTLSWRQLAHRRYRITASIAWTQVSAAATSGTYDIRNDAIPYRETFWNEGSPLSVGKRFLISPTSPFPVVTADRDVSVSFAGGSGPGASRVSVNSCWMMVEDIGPG
jgi:hypothetical protein